MSKPPTLVDPNKVRECTKCRTAFGNFNRKHHCRRCGKVYCNNCSNHEIVLPKFERYFGNQPVRVCDKCFYDERHEALEKAKKAQKAGGSRTEVKSDSNPKIAPSFVQKEQKQQSVVSSIFDVPGAAPGKPSNNSTKPEKTGVSATPAPTASSIHPADKTSKKKEDLANDIFGSFEVLPPSQPPPNPLTHVAKSASHNKAQKVTPADSIFSPPIPLVGSVGNVIEPLPPDIVKELYEEQSLDASVAENPLSPAANSNEPRSDDTFTNNESPQTSTTSLDDHEAAISQPQQQKPAGALEEPRPPTLAEAVGPIPPRDGGIPETYARRNTQIKVFTRWANSLLYKRGIAIQDLVNDFISGVVLVQLAEILTGVNLPMYMQNPQNDRERMGNMLASLDWFQQCGRPISIADVNAMLQGDVGAILDCLWGISYRFVIEPKQFQGNSGIGGVLSWTQAVTMGYPGINIYNFNTSFMDGLVFCAICNRGNSFALDYSLCNPYEGYQNLSLGMGVAANNWGVPILMDPEDMLTEPDDVSIILYLGLLFESVSINYN